MSKDSKLVNLDTEENTEVVEQTENSVDESVDDDGSASATDTNEEGQSEEKSEADKQDAIQKAINRKHFRQKEAERKYEAERRRVKELEAQLAQQGPHTTPPVVPDLPDAFDPDYEKKVVERDKAIRERYAYEMRERIAQEQQAKEAETAHQKAVEETNSRVKTFRANAEKLKLDPSKLSASENIVGTFIDSPDIAKYLLETANGPLLVDYLANNVHEFDNMQGKSVPSQVEHLVTTVLPKALKSTGRVSKTPDPIKKEGSSRSGVKRERPNIANATFE